MPDMSYQELSQAQMGRMKELNEAGFRRVGKSGLFENGPAVIDVKSDGSLALMIDYDPYTDWSKVRGFQVGGGEFDGFSIVSIDTEGTVMERTLNGSGGGFFGKNPPNPEKFRGKTMARQLLDTGFTPDKTDPEILRYQLGKEREEEKGEVIVWTDTQGRIERIIKPIKDSIQEKIDDKTQIIDCRMESGRFGGSNAVLTVRNRTMEFQISTQYGGWLVEGSQKLLRNVTPQELDIKPFAVIKEASGFQIGGRNETRLIRGLKEIASQSISSLEARMRPMHDSMAGFLGQNESLVEVMAGDNDFVLSRGLTHQDLASVLLYAREHYFKGFGEEFSLGGHRYKVDMIGYRGIQFSPFEDETGAAHDMTITNVDTGASLSCSTLLPDMIQRYGFYEGHGTSYRLEPAEILEVFDFLVKS
jgi:hypothetical protein